MILYATLNLTKDTLTLNNVPPKSEEIESNHLQITIRKVPDGKNNFIAICNGTKVAILDELEYKQMFNNQLSGLDKEAYFVVEE